MSYVANARMYSVNAAAATAWTELFGWLARESRVDLTVVPHAYPAPLPELWARPDLACAFMCGFPYTRARHPPLPVVAPVPRAAPVQGRPLYATCLVVKADRDYASLEDTFGGRLGFTVEDSHSGYNALRHHLLPYWRRRHTPLYAESIGPLTTPRRVIDAVLAGDIDVGPLDGYALNLMLRHEPELRRQIKVVAATDAAPIPFLVASPQCPRDVIAALRQALLDFGDAPGLDDLKDRLCLERFVTVDVADYGVIARWEAEAIAAGYPQPR